jgi:hypothetical protein
MKNLVFSAAVLLVVFSSCKSGDKKQTAAHATQPAQENNNTVPAAPPTQEGPDKLSFKVNDTLVRTNKTAGGDTDENIGLFTESTGYFSLSLMGDVPNRPHRGWLNFSLKGFKFEPATYSVSKDNHVSFSRYETINAGGEIGYEASGQDVFKGTEMNLTITKIVPDPESFNGRDWLASGTFSAKMLIKEHNPYKRTSNEGLNITEGTFENVRIAGGPKHGK